MAGRAPRVAAAFAVAAILLGAGSASTSAERAAPRGGGAVALGDVLGHVRAFQGIADRHGGTRAAGTRGYDASARYVAGRLRRAGYRVTVQRFTFPFVGDRSPPVLERGGSGEWRFRPGRDYATLAYSGSGDVEGDVVAVDLLVPSPRPDASTSGCEGGDFAGFPRGAIALVQRGSCTFRQKAVNAVEAGARAVVVFNEGNAGRRELFGATLGSPQFAVPVLAASTAVGEALRGGVRTGRTGARARVRTDVVALERRTSNVLAESRAGSAAEVVMAGAHLDSVGLGPGMNDNASGAAAILAVAESLAKLRSRHRLRFAWWGAEELGLVGSRHYVAALSASERRRIALYLNLDMVASRNFVPFVYDGDGSSGRPRLPLPRGSSAVERVLGRAFAAWRLAYRETSLGEASDHAPFARAGIPVGGLFTGASGRKSPEQADAFGGRAGEPLDPCYHSPCDTLANVNRVALLRMTRVTADAVRLFADDLASVRRLR